MISRRGRSNAVALAIYTNPDKWLGILGPIHLVGQMDDAILKFSLTREGPFTKPSKSAPCVEKGLP